MNWKEQLKPKVIVFQEIDEPVRDVILAYLNIYWDKLKPFIETEIIEKLIEEIPGTDGNYGNNWNSNDLYDLKQQLRDKWL
jgi:hypothetical protein